MLLVGGGNYVSALLLSTGMASGFASALSAMIIGVAPIFFIPAVLKKSMAAAGNIGAKISGFGQKAGAKLGGAAENSAAVQNARNLSKMRQTRMRAGLDKNGKPVEMGRMGRFIRGGKYNIAANRAQYLKDEDTRSSMERLNSDRGMKAALVGQEEKAAAAAAADTLALTRQKYANSSESAMRRDMSVLMKKSDPGSMRELGGLTSYMQERFGAGTAGYVADMLDTEGAVSDEALTQLQTTMRYDSDFANDMKNKQADAFQQISNGISIDENGNSDRKDLSYYSKNQNIATKNLDRANLSASAMRRMLTVDEAKALKASDNLDVQNALTDEKKMAALNDIIAGKDGLGVHKPKKA